MRAIINYLYLLINALLSEIKFYFLFGLSRLEEAKNGRIDIRVVSLQKKGSQFIFGVQFGLTASGTRIPFEKECPVFKW